MNPAADLMLELASGMPSLPRAACRGRAAMFDDPGGVEAAVQMCAYCPEREPCARWAADQPPRTLTGVVAGVDRTYTFHNHKKETQTS
jgi:hypothetical protein